MQQMEGYVSVVVLRCVVPRTLCYVVIGDVSRLSCCRVCRNCRNRAAAIAVVASREVRWTANGERWTADGYREQLWCVYSGSSSMSNRSSSNGVCGRKEGGQAGR